MPLQGKAPSSCARRRRSRTSGRRAANSMTAKRSKAAARSVWKAFDELTPEFAALITEFTSRPRVTYGGRGFGARALRVDGRIFAMLDSKSRFVVKLPLARAATLLAGGQAVLFE